MKILMLSDVYFPRINGVSTSIQTFRRQFAALGHEVLLIAPAYGPATEPEPGIVRLPARTVPLDPEDRMMGFRAVLKLEPALRERRFDLIHIQTPFVAHYAGVALSKRLGVPRIETYHTFFEEYLHHYVPVVPGAWTRALARRFSRAQCNDLDAVVVPSRAMREVLREYGVHAPVEIIPTGIELERLSGGNGAAFRQRHGIPPERPVLVHVGRVAFEKNIDFLLRMLVRVRAECLTCCWSSRARGRRADTCNASRGGWGWSATCFSSVTSTGATPCSTATAPGTPSCSRHAPRPRGWCCWRRWRWVCRSCPPPSWARATLSGRSAARWCRRTTKRISPNTSSG